MSNAGSYFRDLPSPEFDLRWEIVPYTRGRGVMVNPKDVEKLFDHFIGVDEAQLELFAGQSMDFAIVYARTMSDETFDKCRRLLKPGGHLVVWRRAGDKFHAAENLPGWDMVYRTTAPDQWLWVLQKINNDTIKKSLHNDRPSPTALVVRYGGFGDMIQTASVIAGLKAEGYYTILNTTPAGYEIAQSDPNIDEFMIQDKDQVPNHDLGAYWGYLSKKFDCFVQLSESVEGSLLSIPGRPNFTWSHEVREYMLNVNYLEFMHRLADIPFDFKPAFYATTPEKAQAVKRANRMRPARPIILWTLSGSSAHKTWPYTDNLVARILLDVPDARIVFAGDGLSQMLEMGWEKEPRVIKKCGKWSIRETLAFAKYGADIVIGPETGVLNAVSHLDVPKVLFLSHSSIINLSRDWLNCTNLVPEDCDCYPCHRMHYGFDYCPRDKAAGTAVCQAKISLDQAYRAIENIIHQHRRAA